MHELNSSESQGSTHASRIFPQVLNVRVMSVERRQFVRSEHVHVSGLKIAKARSFSCVRHSYE
jgi:hypothetical protein